MRRFFRLCGSVRSTMRPFDDRPPMALYAHMQIRGGERGHGFGLGLHPLISFRMRASRFPPMHQQLDQK